MTMYTNEGLVKHAEKALALKTKYMWGGILRPITKAYINTLRNIYGNQSGTGYNSVRWNDLQALAGKGYYGCDCVGLIKSYYWSGKTDGGTGSPNYGAAGFPDVNAGMMYNKATRKGRISTLPERPGVIVYCRTHPHVGVYIGNGWVIESTLGSRGDGVVKTKLSAFGWEYWFECPYIEYKSKDIKANEQTVTLAFDAAIRSEPRNASEKLGVLTAGSKCCIIKDSDTDDPVSKYTYVRLSGGSEKWIVESAIRK